MTDNKEVYHEKINLLNQYESKVNVLKNIINMLLISYQQQGYLFLPDTTTLELYLDVALYRIVQDAIDIETLNYINSWIMNLIDQTETIESKIDFIKELFYFLDIDFMISDPASDQIKIINYHEELDNHATMESSNDNVHPNESLTSIKHMVSKNEMDVEKIFDGSTSMFPSIIDKLIQANHTLLTSEAILGINTGVKIGSKVSAKIRGQEILVVLGSTGAGKSTIINYLHGCKLIRSDKVALVSKESEVKPITTIGHGHHSSTFIPNIIASDESKIIFCDAPGFNDSRGSAINIINMVNIHQILSSAARVKFLVLLNYSELYLDRSSQITKLNNHLVNIFGGEENLKLNTESVLIGINKFPKNSELDVESLRKDLCHPKGILPENFISRIYIIDPLELRNNLDEQREFWHKLIKNTPPMITKGNNFKAVLLPKDELFLLDVSQTVAYEITKLLENNFLEEVQEHVMLLSILNIIQHPRVKEIYLNQLTLLHDYIMHLVEKIKNNIDLKKNRFLTDDLTKVKALFQLFEKDFPEFKNENYNLERYILNSEISLRVESIIKIMKKLLEIYHFIPHKGIPAFYVENKMPSDDMLTESSTIYDMLDRLEEFKRIPFLSGVIFNLNSELEKLNLEFSKLEKNHPLLNSKYNFFVLYNNFITIIHRDYQAAIGTQISKIKIEVNLGFNFLFNFILSPNSTTFILDILTEINQNTKLNDIQAIFKRIGWDINLKAARYLYSIVSLILNLYTTNFAQEKIDAVRKVFLDKIIIFKENLKRLSQRYSSGNNPEAREKRIKTLCQIKILKNNIVRAEEINKKLSNTIEIVSSDAHDNLPIKPLSMRAKMKLLSEKIEWKKHLSEVLQTSAQLIKVLFVNEVNNFKMQTEKILIQINNDKRKREEEKKEILNRRAQEIKTNNQELKSKIEQRVQLIISQIEERKKTLDKEIYSSGNSNFQANKFMYASFFKDKHVAQRDMHARLNILEKILIDLVSKQYSRGRAFMFDISAETLIAFEEKFLHDLIEINANTASIEKQKQNFESLILIDKQIKDSVSKLILFVNSYNSFNEPDPCDNQINEVQLVLQGAISKSFNQKESTISETEIKEIVAINDVEIQTFIKEKKSFSKEISDIFSEQERVLAEAESAINIEELKFDFQFEFSASNDIDDPEFNQFESDALSETVIEDADDINFSQLKEVKNFEKEISEDLDREAAKSDIFDTQIGNEIGESIIKIKEFNTKDEKNYKNLSFASFFPFTCTDKANKLRPQIQSPQFQNQIENTNILHKQ